MSGDLSKYRLSRNENPFVLLFPDGSDIASGSHPPVSGYGGAPQQTQTHEHPRLPYLPASSRAAIDPPPLTYPPANAHAVIPHPPLPYVPAAPGTPVHAPPWPNQQIQASPSTHTLVPVAFQLAQRPPTQTDSTPANQNAGPQLRMATIRTPANPPSGYEKGVQQQRELRAQGRGDSPPGQGGSRSQGYRSLTHRVLRTGTLRSYLLDKRDRLHNFISRS